MWKWVIAVASGAASFFYGGWSEALTALFVFTTVDYVSGLIAAVMTTGLNSKVGFKGGLRKVLIYLMVAVAHYADVLISSSGTMETNNMIMSGTIAFYCINEALSIFENAGRAGLKVPPQIKKVFEQLRDKEGDDTNAS